MAMAMAMARARMAISHCCNGIRQISVRRFAAVAGETSHSNDGSCSCVRPRGFGPSPLFHPSVIAVMLGYVCLNVSKSYKEEKEKEKFNERLRKMLEENGISRESCEATIAHIKQKIESGSASSSDRYDLKINEEWLQLFIKGA